jgi:hypothetical protein
MTAAYSFLVLLPLFTLAPFRTSAGVLSYYVLHLMFQFILLVANGFRLAFFTIAQIAVRIVKPVCQIPVARRALQKEATTMHLRLTAFLGSSFRPIRHQWSMSQADNTSLDMQDEALSWLVKIPLDPTDTGNVVQILESIRAPRFRIFARSHVISFLSVSLESCFKDKALTANKFGIARDCLLVLSRIKCHLAVESDIDADNRIGNVIMSGFAAWAVQTLLRSHTMDPATSLKLSAAAAWLSPVESIKDDQYGEIKDRGEYLSTIKSHIRGYTDPRNVYVPMLLLEAVQAMHASIPRGNYGQSSAVTPFLHFFSDNLDSPWLVEDEALHALAFYALDLITPSDLVSQAFRKWARGDKSVDVNYLFAKLVGLLKTPSTQRPLEVVGFVFSVVYIRPTVLEIDRTPYPLDDIARICQNFTNPNVESIHQILQRGMMAYTATLHYALESKNRSKFLVKDIRSSLFFVLNRLEDEDSFTQYYSVYALSVVLKVSPTPEILRRVDSEIIMNLLFSAGNASGTEDVEKGNGVLDSFHLKIHLALILRATRVQVAPNEARLPGLMRIISDVAVTDSDPRTRWTAIYLAVLVGSLTDREGVDPHVARLLEGLQSRLEKRNVDVVRDWERFGLPFREAGMDSELMERAPKVNDAFKWVGGGTCII